MTNIKFRHLNGKYDMVNSNGLQLCIDRGEVGEFYRPLERQWVNPMTDPVRKSSDQSVTVMGQDRRYNTN